MEALTHRLATHSKAGPSTQWISRHSAALGLAYILASSSDFYLDSAWNISREKDPSKFWDFMCAFVHKCYPIKGKIALPDK